MIETKIEKRSHKGGQYYIVLILKNNKYVGFNKFYDFEKAKNFSEEMKKAKWI